MTQSPPQNPRLSKTEPLSSCQKLHSPHFASFSVGSAALDSGLVNGILLLIMNVTHVEGLTGIYSVYHLLLDWVLGWCPSKLSFVFYGTEPSLPTELY